MEGCEDDWELVVLGRSVRVDRMDLPLNASRNAAHPPAVLYTNGPFLLVFCFP